MSETKVYLIRIMCKVHGWRMWHIIRTDGHVVCLACRLEGREEPARVQAEDVKP